MDRFSLNFFFGLNFEKYWNVTNWCIKSIMKEESYEKATWNLKARIDDIGELYDVDLCFVLKSKW